MAPDGSNKECEVRMRRSYPLTAIYSCPYMRLGGAITPDTIDSTLEYTKFSRLNLVLEYSVPRVDLVLVARVIFFKKNSMAHGRYQAVKYMNINVPSARWNT